VANTRELSIPSIKNKRQLGLGILVGIVLVLISVVSFKIVTINGEKVVGISANLPFIEINKGDRVIFNQKWSNDAGEYTDEYVGLVVGDSKSNDLLDWPKRLVIPSDGSSVNIQNTTNLPPKDHYIVWYGNEKKLKHKSELSYKVLFAI
jgi:hypothetical protein